MDDTTFPLNQHFTSPTYWMDPKDNPSLLSLGAKSGITIDNTGTIIIPFTQIPLLYSGNMFGADNPRKTTGSSDYPVLDHSRIAEFGVTIDLVLSDDESWGKEYDTLKSNLPADIQAELDANMLLPPDQRNPALVALNASLILGAMFLSGLDTSANSTSASTNIAITTAVNAALIGAIALPGSLAVAADVTALIGDVIADLTSNYPNHDYFTAALSNLEAPIALLEEALANITSGTLSPDVQKMVEKAVAELSALGTQLNNVQAGGDLTILNQLVQTLEDVGNALLANQTGSLALSFNIASIGLNSSDSVAGIVGNTLAQANNVTDFVVSNALSSASASINDLLTNLVMFASILTVALASEGVMPGNSPHAPADQFPFPLAALLIGTMGIDPTSSIFLGAIVVAIGLASHALAQTFGTYSLKDPTDLPAAHFFAFDILLNGIIGADLINTFFHSFIASTSGDEAGAAKLAPIFTLMMLTLAILSAVGYGKQPPETLLEQFSPTIHKGLTSLKEILDKAGSDTTGTSTASVAVDEALLSLENHDFARLMGALSSFLDLNGTSLENLVKDIDVLRGAIHIFTEHLGENNNDPVSGVITLA